MLEASGCAATHNQLEGNVYLKHSLVLWAAIELNDNG